MSLTVLIAPSGFTESLSVEAAAACIAQGVRQAIPDATILSAPVADGGEGAAAALVAATRGRRIETTVTGPAGEPVASFWGILGGEPEGRRAAAIDTAAAAGLSLAPRDRRDPTATTSRGVGELILEALDHGAARILVGCGDGCANDGGAGMARALGARLLDAEGRELPEGGGALERLAGIDVSGLDPRLKEVRIDAAVNRRAMLLGPQGAARICGPQNGASRDQVERLERGMELWARQIRGATGRDVALTPGAGASGGLGAGLAAFAGAKLRPRCEAALEYLEFDALLARADLVVTAEVSLDGRNSDGEATCEAARRAGLLGVPTIVLAAGAPGKGACRSGKLLREAAEDAMRLMLVGRRLAERRRSA